MNDISKKSLFNTFDVYYDDGTRKTPDIFYLYSYKNELAFECDC